MFPRLLLISVLLLSALAVSSAQEPEKFLGTRTELITLRGGKPTLTATGDGITSYKAGDVYQRGETSVSLIRVSQLPMAIELPIGYTLFGDTIHGVSSKALFSGSADITFTLPSVTTKETFAQLRILYPTPNPIDPDVPRWVDATIDDGPATHRVVSEAALKERLPDFKSRTLHAFIPSAQYVFIIALRDATKVRDQFKADLELTGTGFQQAIEGRSGKYELKITNRGPDTAMGVVLHAQTNLSFVSVETKDAAKCKIRTERQLFSCKFSSLEKDQSVNVKIVARSEWSRPSRHGQPDDLIPSWLTATEFNVGSTEQDLSNGNNDLRLETTIYRDSNKGPVVELLGPTFLEVFPGPAASVPITVKASDPDGVIKRVEVFEDEKSLGEASLKSEGEYELVVKDMIFGAHRGIKVVVTDNLGRTTSEQVPEFFVNGLAKIEITSPKAGAVLNRSDGEITITIHATNASSPIKKVSLDIWGDAATAVGNDDYVVKLQSCVRKCRVHAIASDANGVETRSEPLEFIVASPPRASLAWFDGEYARELEARTTLKVSNELILLAAAHYGTFQEAEIVKMDIFVDGKLLCSDDEPTQIGYGSNCVWRPSPGRYKLHAVATDVDGMEGKSEVIEVVIERP